MNGKWYQQASFLHSSTAICFLTVSIGAVIYAFTTKNTDLMVKLVDMVIPAYLLHKGVTIGKNGQPPPNPPPPPTASGP